MAENSKIEWTHHTFNPWIGCTKVSPGCANCYAEADFDKRKGFAKWGPQGTRVVTSESNWAKPRKWDREAKAKGVRERVFCASLADVFEGPETMPADAWPKVRAARVRLFHLISETRNLDWLLLTKRPANVNRFCVEERSWSESPPPNVWLGTSVENQAAADERIPHLLRTPAAVRFLSCEPLLGPVQLQCIRVSHDIVSYNPLEGCGVSRRSMAQSFPNCYGNKIDWVIVGGESGPNARPMHPDWARSLRDQCVAAGVAFHFKQWGEYAPDSAGGMFSVGDKAGHIIDELGRLDVRHGGGDLVQLRRVGKKHAGRLLDGRTWDELPLLEEEVI